MELFGAFKSMTPAELKIQVAAKVEEVGLTDKMNVPAGQLSGGMKRRLSLALAFVGSKIVHDMSSFVLVFIN